MRFSKTTTLGLLTACLIPCANAANAQGNRTPAKPVNQAGNANPFGGGGDANQHDESDVVVRVYNVSDLLTSPPNYPYTPGLPTTEQPAANVGFTGGYGGVSGGGAVGGLGGNGQGGGGGGTGFFAVPATSKANRGLNVHHQFGGGSGAGLGGVGPVENIELALERLTDIIFETIGSNWGEEDPSGRAYDIKPYKQMLVIRQTADMHQQIEAFLQELRKQSGSDTMLTVHVHWVPVETGQDLAALQEATKSLNPRTESKGRESLVQLVNERLKSASYQGQITCHSGQTVHLASGARRMVIRGATPSVGFGSAAYTPDVSYPHIGTIVQVKPSLDAERNTVSLDLWSTVTGWEEPGEPVQLSAEFNRVKTDQGETGGGKVQAIIDRVNMQTRHLATTIRLPLDVPRIVGALTNDQSPSNNEKSSTKQLVLVVQVTASDSK